MHQWKQFLLNLKGKNDQLNKKTKQINKWIKEGLREVVIDVIGKQYTIPVERWAWFLFFFGYPKDGLVMIWYDLSARFHHQAQIFTDLGCRWREPLSKSAQVNSVDIPSKPPCHSGTPEIAFFLRRFRRFLSDHRYSFARGLARSEFLRNQIPPCPPYLFLV